MAKRKTEVKQNLANFLSEKLETLNLEFKTVRRQNLLANLADDLDNTYGKTARQVWPTYQAWLMAILDWQASHLTAELPWRDPSLRQDDALRLLNLLVNNRPDLDQPAQTFEGEIIPRLEQRRQELITRAEELWQHESAIRQGLTRVVQSQFYAAGLDESDIDLAFTQKLDAILLSYDPTLAGHASLRTYATSIIYRQLIDQLRRAGLRPALSLSRAKVGDSTPEEIEIESSSLDQRLNYNIAVEGIAVCRVFLEAIEAPDEAGNYLSATKTRLTYYDLLNTILSGEATTSLSLSDAATLLFNLLNFREPTIATQLLELAKKEPNTLQTWASKLQLQQNAASNRVQLSQARRILARRTTVVRQVERFIQVAPYRLEFKERARQNPVKVVDYCFEGLDRFVKLTNQK